MALDEELGGTLKMPDTEGENCGWLKRSGSSMGLDGDRDQRGEVGDERGAHPLSLFEVASSKKVFQRPDGLVACHCHATCGGAVHKLLVQFFRSAKISAGLRQLGGQTPIPCIEERLDGILHRLAFTTF